MDTPRLPAERLHHRLYWKLPPPWRHRGAFADTWRFIMRSQRWSAERMAEWQERKLVEMVRHAARDTAFWRERFAALGMTPEDFRHEWLTVHASWVRQWPDVLGYVQNLVVDRWHDSRTQSASYDAVPVDGIVEFWFRDTDTAARLYASDLVARTQEHAKVFLDQITPFFVETRQIV